MLQTKYAKPKLTSKDIRLIIDSLEYVSLELRDQDANDVRVPVLRDLMNKLLRMNDAN